MYLICWLRDQELNHIYYDKINLMKKSSKILMFAIIIFVIAAGVRIYVILKNHKVGNSQVVCTMEAKLCPDGSYVGRTGPKCEFTVCPIVPAARGDFYKEGVATFNNLGQKANNLYLVYDEAGSPGVSKELLFDAQSQCVFPVGSANCDSLKTLQIMIDGKMVYVSGNSRGEKVLVLELGILEE